MKVISLTLVLAFSFSPLIDAYASNGRGGGYYNRTSPSQRTRTRPRYNRPSSSTSSYQRQRSVTSSSLSQGELSSRIDRLRRNRGISVNEVQLEGQDFVIQGSYRDRNQFAAFMRNLRAERKDLDSLNLETSKKTFGGQTTYDYIIKGRNRWK